METFGISNVAILILSDLIIFSAVAALILYLVQRDSAKQSIAEKKYDTIVSVLIQDITKSQAIYKQEIIDQIQDLITATMRMSVGVEKIVSEVDKITGVAKSVSQNVDTVSQNVEKCSLIHASCPYVKSMNELTSELKRITEELKEIELLINNDMRG